MKLSKILIMAQVLPDIVHPQRSVEDILTDLEGLPIDKFFDESFKQLLLRDPEGITYMGLAREFGVRNNQLTDCSDAYIRETQKLEKGLLKLLRTYDRDTLPPEHRVSYDIYEWFLDDTVRGHVFMYYTYTVHHFLAGFHDNMVRFFTEIHPLTCREDAEDYVSRLSQLGTKIEQALDGLRLRAETGVIPPRFILERTKRIMEKYLHMDSDSSRTGNSETSSKAENISLYTVFAEKLNSIDITKEEKQELLDAALKEIENVFIPAYTKLFAYIEHLEKSATDDAGVWKFPHGDKYYRYILRKETSTNLTPKEIHDKGLKEVNRIQKEMRRIFDELEYPEDESLFELMERVINDAGFYDTTTSKGRNEVVKAYERILEDIDLKLRTIVGIHPQRKVVVQGDMGGGAGGFYTGGSADGSRPGVFHTGVGGSRVPKYSMKTIAYHEAIPGHHFQNALAKELNLPRFRNFTHFNGFIEGWALYAEQLGWELGSYADDPYANIGRLQLELLRAVRMVVDTGIHALKWTRDEAAQYMDEVLGAQKGTFLGEVDRYCVLPGQAAGYMVGMLKILELRDRVKDELGEKFDVKEFHDMILGNGSLPLGILEEIVQEYIKTEKS